ncbi:MAG: hypothetical protein KGJ53_10555 [Alphaproteobacteria bacterium]|nr:hypothetical protein [Alphaproteobacteria bacterium]
MQTGSTPPQIAISIASEDFVALIDFLRARGDALDPALAIREALFYWMRALNGPAETAKRPVVKVPRGYVWRHGWHSVLLEDGTELRMKYKRYMYYAKVIDEEIIFGGKSVSPGMMVMEIAKSPRNAWRDLWVRKPGKETWLLADTLRTPRRRAADMSQTLETIRRLTEAGRGHREEIDESTDPEEIAASKKRLAEAIDRQKKRPRTTNYKGRKEKLIGRPRKRQQT